MRGTRLRAVLKALKIAGRTDLIGSGKNCLITAPKGFVPNNKKVQNKKLSRNKHKKNRR